jgi:predicted enzyme related to lactoylglutathione lyase
MTHRSCLSTIVIDCDTQDIEQATEFWARALGAVARQLPEPDDSNYRQLDVPTQSVNVLVQQVRHPSRVHIDIESDDIEAEVRRLEALGARRVQRIKRWWVMEAPTGQRFCIVQPQRDDFGAHAHSWE